MSDPAVLIPVERIPASILEIRRQRILLDSDLAQFYDVETRILTRAVQRNRDRFPDDFMFQLTETEFGALRSHIGISNQRGGRRYLPYAFTEHGVLMLANVLRSPYATQVSIAIVRAFVRLRQAMASHEELVRRLDELAAKVDTHDEQLTAILDWIRDQIAAVDAVSYRRLGFR